MRRSVALIMLFGLVCAVDYSTAQPRPYSAAFTGTFTTSSKLFPHPHVGDEILRSQFDPFDNIVGAGIDIRRQIDEISLTLGIGAEYLHKVKESQFPTGAEPIPVLDGFTVIPIEFTAYFFIPVGTDQFHLYMGGGGGMYFGTRSYEYGGISAPTFERSVGSGIHVVSGMELGLTDDLSIRGEVKFRDVQFETTNQFPGQQTTIPFVNTDPFSSRINIDGMNMGIGLAYHF